MPSGMMVHNRYPLCFSVVVTSLDLEVLTSSARLVLAALVSGSIAKI